MRPESRTTHPPAADTLSGSAAKPRIFLDCDGVLADFDEGAAAVLGMPPKEFRQRCGLKQFWARLAAVPDFFATLDPLPDALALHQGVSKYDQPIVLTGLPRGNWAEGQKRAWVERHFPGMQVITTRAALKCEHCLAGDVLIDDTSTYRQRWEEAGGIFIHHSDAISSLSALRGNGIPV